MDHATILDAIESSLLSAAEYRLARRLLDRVSNQWTVYLTREQACTLCGTETWAGARKMLNRLADAGIIQLHTNNCAYITFLGRADLGTQRAQNDANRAESARPTEPQPRQNDAPARQNGAFRADLGTYRADLARVPRDQGSRDWDRDGRDIPSLPSEGGAGEDGQPKRRGPIDPAESVRSVALLTDPDVGLSEAQAVEVAAKHPWQEVRRQVFRYMRDVEDGKAAGPGCLPYRIGHPRKFPAQLTEGDRASPLWQRHHSEEETAAMEAEERRRRYMVEE